MFNVVLCHYPAREPVDELYYPAREPVDELYEINNSPLADQIALVHECL